MLMMLRSCFKLVVKLELFSLYHINSDVFDTNCLF